MKQIYDFEQYRPPVLNETMLKNKLKQRTLQRTITWLAFASYLILACIYFAALQLYPIAPLLSLFFLCYLCIAITGNCVIILIFIIISRNPE